jgi:glycerol kinase
VTALVLGLDQGTSSTRCVALDDALCELGSSSVAVASSFPRAGLVEQDPEAIAASAERAIAGALAAAGARPRDVAALGIANQTETFVVWERASGRAIHPAIVWQDRRTDEACGELRAQDHAELVRERTGLELDATFPATKLRWLLDHVGGADEGRLAYGDVASWLLHRLAGIHVCDAGNAGRSLLCPLGGLDWDDELLELFGVPRTLLPPIVDSDGIDAVIGGIPVRAAVGDQQASLFGLRCWEPGTAKVTLGTGAFVLAQAGQAAPRPPDGVLASCAWRREATTSYALEGFIPTAGAALDWFARLGALPAGRDLDALLSSAGRGDPGVVCVPALQGFGSPTWDAGARGAVLGLSLGTTRADLARAVVDGILHQLADAVEAMGEAVTLDAFWVDGGLSRSDWIVQRLADLAGVRVQRTARSDSTALGAATLAGLAARVWDGLDALPEVPLDLVAEPELAPADRTRERERWAAARELTAGPRSLRQARDAQWPGGR